MGLKLIPIHGSNLVKKWGYFTEGMEKVIRHAKEDENLTTVYNDILAGRVQMWAGFIDKRYVGFIATQVFQTAFGDRRLLIRSIFSSEKVPEEVWQEGYNILDDYAKRMGCKTMEFYTTRDKAFEKTLKEYRWQPKYTIFEREVI